MAEPRLTPDRAAGPAGDLRGPRPRGPGAGPAGRLGQVVPLLLCWALSGPALLHAQPGPATLPDGRDFAPDNPGWNGLTDLLALWRVAGIEVTTPTRLDWRDQTGHGLVVLQPSADLDRTSLARLLAAGGRVLLGGEQDAARRLPGHEEPAAPAPPRATLTFQGRPELPFALPAGTHPVTAGDPLVLANHAGQLPPGSTPLLVFAGPDGEVLLGEQEIGPGRLLLLADPSVLINDMLDFEGNRLLALNLAHHLCEAAGSARPCRLVVVTGDCAQRASWRDDLAAALGRLRHGSEQLDRRLRLAGPELWPASGLLLAVALLGLLVVLPFAVHAPRPAPPHAEAELLPPDDLTLWSQGLAAAGPQGDQRLLSALLRRQARATLARELGEGSAAEQIARYLRRHGEPPGGEAGLASLLAELAEGPSPEDLYRPGCAPCSPAELQELAERWQELQHLLDQSPVTSRR